MLEAHSQLARYFICCHERPGMVSAGRSTILHSLNFSTTAPLYYACCLKSIFNPIALTTGVQRATSPLLVSPLYLLSESRNWEIGQGSRKSAQDSRQSSLGPSRSFRLPPGMQS
jgi:hypothetical protein